MTASAVIDAGDCAAALGGTAGTLSSPARLQCVNVALLLCLRLKGAADSFSTQCLHGTDHELLGFSALIDTEEHLKTMCLPGRWLCLHAMYSTASPWMSIHCHIAGASLQDTLSCGKSSHR